MFLYLAKFIAFLYLAKFLVLLIILLLLIALSALLLSFFFPKSYDLIKLVFNIKINREAILLKLQVKQWEKLVNLINI